MEEGRDARNWREKEYARSVLSERENQSRNIFRAIFAPSNGRNPDILIVASSDGLISSYSISSCICAARSPSRGRGKWSLRNVVVAEPLHCLRGHSGPAYDVKFYQDDEGFLLLSCGDDGRIRGWKWSDIVNSKDAVPMQGTDTNSVLDLKNPQQSGPWCALSPIPENNAIAVDPQSGSIFSAAGDACAYCWDVEKCICKMVFKGHSNYLHCVIACPSRKQIITGSEDGTARLWDCRTGKCIRVIDPVSKKKGFSWISCIAVDESENWLACGSAGSLSVWNLSSCECILNVDAWMPIQDMVFDGNQVTAVGGYGGVVDVMSRFGSHLCTFCCPEM